MEQQIERRSSSRGAQRVAPLQRRDAGTAPHHAAALAMQRSAGNAAVAAAFLQRKVTKASPPPKGADANKLVNIMWPKVDFMWKSEFGDANPNDMRIMEPDL